MEITLKVNIPAEELVKLLELAGVAEDIVGDNVGEEVNEFVVDLCDKN